METFKVSKENTGTTITVSSNEWRVPSIERAMDGCIEGRPTEEQKLRILEEVQIKRNNWKPSTEALAIVDELRKFIGHRIRIQFWDPIMYWLEEEGPYPMEADCMDILILDEDGFSQAYIQIRELKEIPNPDGYSPKLHLAKRNDVLHLLAPFAELYQITRLDKLPKQ